LDAVRRLGDWEGWIRFFLGCVQAAAAEGVRVAQALHALIGRDRNRLLAHERATVAAIQLLDLLPSNPIVTVLGASKLLGLTAPPASKAIGLLEGLGILCEITGKRRSRAYEYQEYLQVLTEDEL
jgi:Fic family protein